MSLLLPQQQLGKAGLIRPSLLSQNLDQKPRCSPHTPAGPSALAAVPTESQTQSHHV